ncbi:MAG: ABC transporter ATP-binding protein [Leptospiraceae bacterium]|nr:ABC transporter ATP-binding protein [Saprospirales bacterium]MBK9501193.1 ABC transporter ATP-binding protein [Leptospiraceae bacterium]
MSDLAIKISNLTKIYPLYRFPKHRFFEALSPTRKKYHEDFYALDDISFEVKKGETVGVVGVNGSGKSTLLKIITGVLTPTSGIVSVNGNISSLLELGTGFNPELSGMENIYFFGMINGKLRNEMEPNVEPILSFADIGNFIYQPVKSYSSGMFVRLAFACAININPEILIVDEALSVGDARFQAKCFAKLKDLIDRGTTILFVSHSTEQITTHCDHAILLNQGKIVEQGEPKKIVNIYLDLLFGKKSEPEEKKIVTEEIPEIIEIHHHNELQSTFESRPYYNPAEYRWGDRAAEILDFVLYQDQKKFPSLLCLDKKIQIEFRISFHQEILIPIFGFALKTKEGVTLYNTNTNMQERTGVKSASSYDEWFVTIDMPMILFTGDYFISVGLASKAPNGEIIPHDRRYDSIHLQIEHIAHFSGFVDLKAGISIEVVSNVRTT